MGERGSSGVWRISRYAPTIATAIKVKQGDYVGLLEGADSRRVVTGELDEEPDGGVSRQVDQHDHSVGSDAAEEAHDYEEEEDVGDHFVGDGGVIAKLRHLPPTGAPRACRCSGPASSGGCGPSPRGGRSWC